MEKWKFFLEWLNTRPHTSVLIQPMFSAHNIILTPAQETSIYRNEHGVLICENHKLIHSQVFITCKSKISDIPLQNTFAVKKGVANKLPVPLTQCNLK